MIELPLRIALDRLTAAAQAIIPATAIGFSRSVDGNRTSILYVYGHGVGGFDVAADETAEALRPETDRIQQAPRAVLEAHRGRAAEAFLLDVQTKGLVSLRLAGIEPATRFWVGLAQADPLTLDQLRQFEELADEAGRVVTAPLAASRASAAGRTNLCQGRFQAIGQYLPRDEKFPGDPEVPLSVLPV